MGQWADLSQEATLSWGERGAHNEPPLSLGCPGLLIALGLWSPKSTVHTSQLYDEGSSQYILVGISSHTHSPSCDLHTSVHVDRKRRSTKLHAGPSSRYVKWCLRGLNTANRPCNCQSNRACALIQYTGTTATVKVAGYHYALNDCETRTCIKSCTYTYTYIYLRIFTIP